MKTRLTIVIASLLATSLAATAFAQDTQQVPPQQPTPTQQPMPPQQQTLPEQQPAPPPQPTPPPTSAAAANAAQATSTSGSKIDHAVKRALTRNGVTATGVHVAFAGGTATLTGSVYNKQDIAKAKRAAMQVAGVTQVDVSGLHARKG